VTVDGRELPARRWSVERGGTVLVASFGGRRAELVVEGC
jgi:hypothetical protein